MPMDSICCNFDSDLFRAAAACFNIGILRYQYDLLKKIFLTNTRIVNRNEILKNCAGAFAGCAMESSPQLAFFDVIMKNGSAGGRLLYPKVASSAESRYPDERLRLHRNRS